MIQSPLGYPMRREDAALYEPDEPLPANRLFHEVGNDLAYWLDIRGQHKGSWTAVAGTERTATGSDLNSKQGLTSWSWAETIGPFPLWLLPTGQPETVYVEIALATSNAGQPVFAYVVLRHADQDSAEPYSGNPGVRDGWTLGYVESDAELAGDETDWQPPICVSAALEAASPMGGVLQFHKDDWRTTWTLLADQAEEYGPIDCVMACVDIYLGRLSASATAELHGYLVRSAAYGARDPAVT